VGKKKRGDKDMNLSIRVSGEFIDALREARWHLRKNVSEILRDGAIEYLEKHLPKDALKKVNRMLNQAPERRAKGIN